MYSEVLQQGRWVTGPEGTGVHSLPLEKTKGTERWDAWMRDQLCQARAYAAKAEITIIQPARAKDMAAGQATERDQQVVQGNARVQVELDKREYTEADRENIQQMISSLHASARSDNPEAAMDAYNLVRLRTELIKRAKSITELTGLLGGSNAFLGSEALPPGTGSEDRIQGYISEVVKSLQYSHDAGDTYQAWMAIGNIARQISDAPPTVPSDSLESRLVAHTDHFEVLQRLLAEIYLNQCLQTPIQPENIMQMREVSEWLVRQYNPRQLGVKTPQKATEARGAQTQQARGFVDLDADDENDLVDTISAENTRLLDANLLMLLLNTVTPTRLNQLTRQRRSPLGLFAVVSAETMSQTLNNMSKSPGAFRSPSAQKIPRNMARAIGTYTFVPKITPPLTPLELRVTYEGIAPKDTPRLFPRDDLLPALGAARRAISEIDPEHPAQDLEVLNRQIELLITDITLRLTILDTEFSFQGLRQVYDDLGRLSEALNRIPDVNDDNGLQRHHTKMQTNIARWREGVLNVSKEFVYQRGENAEADKQVVPDSTINMRNGRSDNSEAWMTFYTSEQDARDYFLQQLSQSAGSHAEDSN